MNRYMQEKWPWIEGTHGMRSHVISQAEQCSVVAELASAMSSYLAHVVSLYKDLRLNQLKMQY